MVGHDDVRQDAHVERLTDLVEQVFEIEVVLFRFKYASLTICAINHVVHVVADVGARLPDHKKY